MRCLYDLCSMLSWQRRQLITWHTHIYYLRFQVLTAGSMMFRIVFWDILPCKIIVGRRFRGAYCLHHQGQLFYTAVHPRIQFWTIYNLFFAIGKRVQTVMEVVVGVVNSHSVDNIQLRAFSHWGDATAIRLRQESLYSLATTTRWRLNL
jgi:hypothetical protein